MFGTVFLIGLAAYIATCGTIGLAILCWDRVVVLVMKATGLHLFPEAIAIAVSIERRPEEWHASTHTLTHAKIGTIWTGNACYGIKVQTAMGEWVPNPIERRIIRQAVDWRLKQFLKNRIALAMQESPRLQV